MSAAETEKRYRELFGFIPDNVMKRSALAKFAGHEGSIDTIEALRASLIHDNPLERKTQQLVHFAMLVALGHTQAAKLHVQGALKAGATPGELYGVCETAAIVGGMPVFSNAVDIVYAALHEAGLMTGAEG